MTFQLNFDSISEDDDRLRIFYNLEGKLPIDGYRITPIKFNFEKREFDVSYSITGNFVVETDLVYAQSMNDRLLGSMPVTTTSLERLNIKLNQQISQVVSRKLPLLKSSQRTLDDL